MKKALLKDGFKQIIKTRKRFISILLMAFLGVGFFAGVKATSPDMKMILDTYFDEKNIYDVEVMSTLGLTEDDLNALSKIEGVESVNGLYSKDVYTVVNEKEIVIKALQYSKEINDVELIDGKLPEKENECVIEKSMAQYEKLKIGDKLKITEDLKKDEDPAFKETNLTITGIIISPLYMSRDRGTTTLGSGKLSYYVYVSEKNVIADYYTQADIIVDGAKELAATDDEYQEKLDSVTDNIKQIKATREKARYDELIGEATTKIDDAQRELDEKKAEAEEEIAKAENDIAKAKKDIANGEKELADGEAELQSQRTKADLEFIDAEKKINESQDKLSNGQNELNAKVQSFNNNEAKAYDSLVQAYNGIQDVDVQISNVRNLITTLDTIQELENQLAELEAKITESYNEMSELRQQIDAETDEDKKKELQEKYDTLGYTNAALSKQKTTLADRINGIKSQIGNAVDFNKSIEENKATLNASIETMEQAKANVLAQCKVSSLEELKNNIEAIKGARKKFEDAQKELNQGWTQLNQGKEELGRGRAEAAQKFAEADAEIEANKKKIKDAKKKLTDGETELNEKKAEFEEKVADAEAKLIDAREKINDIETAKWYIFDRTSNNSFSSFSKDCDNIYRLGIVFPVAFFLIATLMSLTTMSRMVEEDRVLVGTYKALGYSKFDILRKYIFYSLIASIIGGITGAIFGQNFIPSVIISMYQLMYDFPRTIIELNTVYTIVGLVIMAVCITGASVYTGLKELSFSPAELMRPKAPAIGKRVLLERIPFIWKHLNFTRKVTVRNIFRYKKKFLMTIIGISGCTALIVTGYGLKDSISRIMDYQYGDVYHYDMLIGLKNSLTQDQISSLREELINKNEIVDLAETYMTGCTASNGNLSEDTSIVATNNQEELNKAISLSDYKTGESLILKDDEVIITDKLAQLLNVSVGDKIVLKDSDDLEAEVTVSGIAEHYIQHYIYMTDKLYAKIFNVEEYKPNIFYAEYSEDFNLDNEYSLSKELLNNAKISSVTLTSYLRGAMDDTLQSMNLVTYVLIVSAGLLAFIVLYNLINVNISERQRELATIKVLGFYDKEVYDYVSRETVLLTIIGIAVGLVVGYFLDSFILTTCEIGILRFKKIITVQSYLISAGITIIFTIIVNIFTYFSLKKIDMIESLKSVE